MHSREGSQVGLGGRKLDWGSDRVGRNSKLERTLKVKVGMFLMAYDIDALDMPFLEVGHQGSLYAIWSEW